MKEPDDAIYTINKEKRLEDLLRKKMKSGLSPPEKDELMEIEAELVLSYTALSKEM